MYRHAGLKENLSLVSVSTGLKAFAILRSLLERGYLEENGIIVMDEPEVSLHMEWQKRLIDLVMELNPNVQIIMTTHSPAVVMNGWADHVTEVSEITV